MALLACTPADRPADPQARHAGTPELRAALFDTILARTGRREAFSPVKNQALGVDPLEAMRALRADVVNADTDEALYYALARLSAARRDTHLEVMLVPGGLAPPDSAGLTLLGADDPLPAPEAPVRVLPDYGSAEAWSFFVADRAPHRAGAGIEIGERVVSVGGRDVRAWTDSASPYVRASSAAHLRWRLASLLSTRSAALPPSLRSDSLRLTLRRLDGSTHDVVLPFLSGDLAWEETSEPHYPGHTAAMVTPTFELFRPATGGANRIILLWHGFRETLVADVDTLLAYAEREGLLHHDVIVDATRSRGGSKGAYALQRLQPRPFRGTFGNLRISDIVPAFIAEKQAGFAAGEVDDGGVGETMDEGRWLIDWLTTDVQAALDAGAAYSNDVPFKLAHAPRTSDGVLHPIEPTFRGRLTVLSGPRRGSHLDQFVAMVTDNDLGLVVGMPAGGYSNTWEWEETLSFPGTDQPVVAWMWSIGHTVRPDGTLLEGNAAPVDRPLPLTPENVVDYYPALLREAIEGRR